MTLRKIMRANISLSGSNEFRLLSGLLASMRHSIDDRKGPTACTDGLRVYWNEAFVQSMQPKEIAFVVAHEAAHSFFMHNQTAIRLQKVDPQRCALALDHVVNNFLIDSDPDGAVIKMPEQGGKAVGVCDRKYQGWDAFQVFRDLEGKTGGKGGGLDVHEFDPDALTAAEEQELSEAVEAGRRAAEKALGEKREYAEAQTGQRNWKSLLARWLYGRGKGKGLSTWKTPNRRMIGHGIYLPSQVSKSLRRACFVCDTSGSIQGEELAQSIHVFKTILKQLGCEKLDVIYWDHGVARHETYTTATGQKFEKTQPAGGGSTSFEPVLAYMKDNGIRPDVMVGTTDGFVRGWGDKPAWPCLWVMSTSETPPWGEVLRA